MACSDNLDERNKMMPAKGEIFIAPVDEIEISLNEDRAITRGLMRLSERSLARILENESDIYTLEDLKIIF
jgi:hypothetical protein